MKGKYILISILIGGGLIAGALYIVTPPKNQADSELSLSATTVQALSAMGDDNDKDGLIDWEEKLWGTDPNVFDTDGDGTGDGQEISEKRDPKKPGPNDSLVVSTTASTTPSGNPFNEGTFAYSFAQSYASIAGGGKLNTDEKEALAQQLMSEVEDNAILTKQKTASMEDLTVTQQNTAASYIAYAEGFNARIRATNIAEPENEAIVMQRAIQTQNPADFTKLGLIAKSHTDLADALVNLPTPAPVALEHLEIINSLYNVAIAVEGMENAQHDPISGLAALQRYVPATQRLVTATQALATELRKYGVDIE